MFRQIHNNVPYEKADEATKEIARSFFKEYAEIASMAPQIDKTTQSAFIKVGVKSHIPANAPSEYILHSASGESYRIPIRYRITGPVVFCSTSASM
jgi:hypothetical protein